MKRSTVRYAGIATTISVILPILLNYILSVYEYRQTKSTFHKIGLIIFFTSSLIVIVVVTVLGHRVFIRCQFYRMIGKNYLLYITRN